MFLNIFFKFFFIFLNIFFKFVHNNVIRLIIVERRALLDNFLFINVRAKIYYSVDGGNVKEYTDSFALSRTKNHKVYAYAKGANTMQSAESVFIIRK